MVFLFEGLVQGVREIVVGGQSGTGVEIGDEIDDRVAFQPFQPFHLQDFRAGGDIEQFEDLLVGHHVGHLDAIVLEGDTFFVHLVGEARPFIQLGGDIILRHLGSYALFAGEQAFVDQLVGRLSHCATRDPQLAGHIDLVGQQFTILIFRSLDQPSQQLFHLAMKGKGAFVVDL